MIIANLSLKGDWVMRLHEENHIGAERRRYLSKGLQVNQTVKWLDLPAIKLAQ